MKCAIAKAAFEANKVSQGFEALARAQCFLKSKVTLGKLALLTQVIAVLLSCICKDKASLYLLLVLSPA